MASNASSYVTFDMMERRMTLTQQEIWDKLCAFSFDPTGATKLFEMRLAEEQGWSIEFARRAIEEYRRFLLLCATSGHACTPSEVVDEVWHMHLTFTRSYWEDLCPNVLGRPLHHEPGVGIAGENQKHRSAFQQTLRSYETTFRTSPPPAIWKIKLADTKVKSKVNFDWRIGVVAAAALIAVGCAMGEGSNEAGPSLFVLAIVLGGIILIVWAIVTAIRSRFYGGPGSCNGAGCGGGCSAFGGDTIVVVENNHVDGSPQASCGNDSGGGDTGGGDSGGGDSGSSGCGSGCGGGCGGGGD